jgi:hypothetical protein
LKRIKIIVDICMTALLLTLLLTGWKYVPTFEPNLHNILGYVFTGVVIIHLILNGKWLLGAIKNLFRGKLNSQAKYMLVLVIGLFISYSVCLCSGIYMALTRFPFSIYLVHGISAIACVIFTVLHVKIHWAYLKSFFKPKKSEKV